MVKLFSLFEFKMEVAERETYNFNMGNDTVFSLVNASKIAYVEVEKMSSKKDMDENKKQIMGILDQYKLKPITKQKDFNRICDKLSKYSDWSFSGSPANYKKLKNLLSRY